MSRWPSSINTSKIACRPKQHLHKSNAKKIGYIAPIKALSLSTRPSLPGEEALARRDSERKRVREGAVFERGSVLERVVVSFSRCLAREFAWYLSCGMVAYRGGKRPRRRCCCLELMSCSGRNNERGLLVLCASQDVERFAKDVVSERLRLEPSSCCGKE
jgi:hypothetical protein